MHPDLEEDVLRLFTKPLPIAYDHTTINGEPTEGKRIGLVAGIGVYKGSTPQTPILGSFMPQGWDLRGFVGQLIGLPVPNESARLVADTHRSAAYRRGELQSVDFVEMQTALDTVGTHELPATFFLLVKRESGSTTLTFWHVSGAHTSRLFRATQRALMMAEV